MSTQLMCVMGLWNTCVWAAQPLVYKCHSCTWTICEVREGETPASTLEGFKESVDQKFKLHISNWLSLDHEFTYKSRKSTNKSDAPFLLGLVRGVHKVRRLLLHTLTSLPECLSPNSQHLSNKLKHEGVKWKVLWQVLSWCPVWPDSTVIKGWVFTCMTVPYLTTSPWTFLFSVSFCFCSRLEACCNTNKHILVFMWYRSL